MSHFLTNANHPPSLPPSTHRDDDLMMMDTDLHYTGGVRGVGGGGEAAHVPRPHRASMPATASRPPLPGPTNHHDQPAAMMYLDSSQEEDASVHGERATNWQRSCPPSPFPGAAMGTGTPPAPPPSDREPSVFSWFASPATGFPDMPNGRVCDSPLPMKPSTGFEFPTLMGTGEAPAQAQPPDPMMMISRGSRRALVFGGHTSTHTAPATQQPSRNPSPGLGASRNLFGTPAVPTMSGGALRSLPPVPVHVGGRLGPGLEAGLAIPSNGPTPALPRRPRLSLQHEVPAPSPGLIPMRQESGSGWNCGSPDAADTAAVDMFQSPPRERIIQVTSPPSIKEHHRAVKSIQCLHVKSTNLFCDD